MSSAPPGWHLQPDGRERYWDGERWTDEFRDPSSAPTQQIPTEQTQGMPVTDQSGYAGSESPPYSPPPSHQGAYPREGYHQPPGRPPAEHRGGGGMPGWLKGCLLALVVLLLLGALLVFFGWQALSRWADQVTTGQETATSTEAPTDPGDGQATDLPTGTDPPTDTDLPTGLPTDFPTELPGAGESVEVEIGEGFTLGPGEIQPGWEVSSMALGFRSVTMQIRSTEATDIPLLFSLVFFEDGTEIAQTACTAGLGAVNELSDAICVPMRAPAEDADLVQVWGASD